MSFIGFGVLIGCILGVLWYFLPHFPRKYRFHHQIPYEDDDRKRVAPTSEKAALSHIESLITALDDPEMQTRWHAVIALEKIQGTWAIEPLIKALEDPEDCIRERAVMTLVKIGSPACNPLITDLGDSAWQVREKAAEALGKLENPSAAEPLLTVLDDSAWRVQKHAAVALVKVGFPAIEPLIKALDHPERQVRWHAAATLTSIGWTPENERDHLYYVFAQENWTELIALGTPALRLLHRIFETHHHARPHLTDVLKAIYASVDTIQFGDGTFNTSSRQTTLVNPDLAMFTAPVCHLKEIRIYTDTYDFHQLERFLTYAVNHIGQDYLKEHVEVDVYGAPDTLHPNLHNNFMNFCKCIHMHEEDRIHHANGCIKFEQETRRTTTD